MKKAENYILFLIYTSAAALGCYLTVNYILPVFAPFIGALILAVLMEPGVKYMVSSGIKRGAAAAIMTIFTVSVISCAVSCIAIRGMNAASELVSTLPELSEKAAELEQYIAQRLAAIGAGSDYAEKIFNSFGTELNNIPAKLSQWLLTGAAEAAQSGAGAVLFAVTLAIGTYSISATLPRVKSFALMQLSEKAQRRSREIAEDLKSSLGGMIRAELILSLITFLELTVIFYAIKTEKPIFSAAMTAIVDALPVFGTGAVLLPWALWYFISGQSGRAVWLMAGWVLTVLVRNCLQAKLLGDRIGLDPLTSLLAIYAGWKLWGVWGMLLFPVIFAVAAGLNERGIIHLWKTV